MSKEKNLGQMAKELEKAFTLIKKTLHDLSATLRDTLSEKAREGVDNQIDEAEKQLEHARQKTKSADKFYGQLKEIETLFSAGITRAIKTSARTTIVVTLSIAIVSVVANIYVGSSTIEKSKTVSEEAKLSIKKANVQADIPWMTVEEMESAFLGFPSELDSLKYVIASELPYDCNDNVQEYFRLSKTAKNTSGYNQQELDLIKSCLFYCNSKYRIAEQKLANITDEKLEKDKLFLLAIIYMQENRWSEINKIDLERIYRGKSWLGVKEELIHKTVEDIKELQDQNIKGDTGICIFDASVGRIGAPRKSEGERLKQILSFLGWTNCHVHPFDYRKYKKLVGNVDKGLSSQFLKHDLNQAINQQLRKEMKEIPRFGTMIMNSFTSQSSVNRDLLNRLKSDCEGDVVIIVGTEFGGTSESIEEIDKFVERWNKRGVP